MKTVKSEGELMRLAAKAGAEVSLAGRVFNAGGRKLSAVAPAARPQEPPPEPAPAPPQQTIVEVDTAPLAAVQARIGEAMAAAVAEARLASARAPWVFDVEYERDGLRVKRITATPVLQ